jgi:hypothetical protein
MAKKQYPDAQRRWYLRNKEEQIRRINIKKDEIRLYIRKAKAGPCHDCGNLFPHYVMDFDHRPGTVKFCDPAQLHKYGSWKRVHEELAKCDLVCANCHRIRTHQRQETFWSLSPNAANDNSLISLAKAGVA